MTSSSELRRVAEFSDLPEEEIGWFLSHVQEIFLTAGETFVQQGDPADWMFIFLEGLFQWRGEFGGDIVSLPAHAGEISGVFPFSRMKRFTVTGRALTDGRLIRFPAVRFPELIQRLPELTARLVATMSDRIREGTRIEQQRDRLLSLGRLSAGLAHELNNPASAAKRASDQLGETLKKLQRANSELWRLPLDEHAKVVIEEVEASLIKPGTTRLDGLALGDLEEKLGSIMANHGHADPWELSAALARCNMSRETLASLLTRFDRMTARAALERIAASAESTILLDTIASGTARISNLVRTVKEYTYMDQAPIQSVDVTQSLETTLGALLYILKPGIRLQRTYESTPLLVSAVGTQLTQVWTNIIENAVEAMEGHGELRLRTFREEDYGVVEIGDTGPGIPAEVRHYIFDPFFTTKEVGSGTGLGLNTVQTIVRKLGGNIHVTSRPGDTRFQIWLPCGESLAESGKRVDTEVADKPA